MGWLWDLLFGGPKWEDPIAKRRRLEREEAAARKAAAEAARKKIWRKTRKGKVIYERKKHVFEWQRASRICYALINDDIAVDKRDLYYVRMRAGLLGYSYAMLRMYPGFARGYLLSLARGGDSAGDDEFRRKWKDITLGIVNYGLAKLGPSFKGRDEVAGFLGELAESYYDWLFSLGD